MMRLPCPKDTKPTHGRLIREDVTEDPADFLLVTRSPFLCLRVQARGHWRKRLSPGRP